VPQIAAIGVVAADARVLSSRMTGPVSLFAFALTNPGSEKPLKEEVAAAGCGWRPGYQRRGFVMFKAPSDAAPFSLRSLEEAPAFARRLCLSLGKTPARAAAEALLAGTDALHHLRLTNGRMEVTEPPPATPPAAGDHIGTIVELGPEEFWAGLHRHAPLLSPHPGGSSGILLPDGVPSRAWLKLEEAVRFFDLEFTPRDVVVELGCAPGGVVHALLQRGVSVIGVDPAKLAPAVVTRAVPAVPDTSSGPWVFHCRKPAALVSKRDLAGRATWFMSDMNQAPEIAIKECVRFRSMCPAIRSALITLKLTDLSQIVAKPQWLATLRDAGFRTLRLQQLSVHHRELALLALDG
jgi:23S rRNA (cytidine2498-2'-O)-methyltransferase